MTRWMWKRWAWALVTAATLFTGAEAAAQNANKTPAASDKDKDVIVLKFEGQPERKVKVVKTSRQPDGKMATEVKDIATGETLTILDMAPSNSSGAKDTPAKETKEKESKAKEASDTKSATSQPEQPKRQGLLSRLFGRKQQNPAPAASTSSNEKTPAMSSTPPAPLSVKAPSLPPSAGPASTTPANEPPRAMPPKPVAAPVTPPTPVIPAPLPIPTIPPVPGGGSR